MTDFTGLALVTGADSGLGRAMSIELVRAGISVAGFGWRPETLSETATLAGPRFHPYVVDVSDPDNVSDTILQLTEEIAPVTLLINNIAVYPHRDFLDESPQGFMHTMSINLGGLVNCSHAVLKQMVKSGHGRILNISTLADLAPLPATSAYAVSMGACRVFTKALLADIGDRFPDIVINEWMPGSWATDTDFFDGPGIETVAKWGVELALWNERSLTGTVWERNKELLPFRTLKGRIKDRLLFRQLTARCLHQPNQAVSLHLSA